MEVVEPSVRMDTGCAEGASAMPDLPEPTRDTDLNLLDDEGFDATIRRVQHEGRWYFSVVDVVGILTDSANPGTYWRVLKSRLSAEGGAETVTKCNRLKMRAADGKQRLTDAADTETLLRIIQSVPSPKAEPIKQ
jgi:hypothetical protein